MSYSVTEIWAGIIKTDLPGMGKSELSHRVRGSAEYSICHAFVSFVK